MSSVLACGEGHQHHGNRKPDSGQPGQGPQGSGLHLVLRRPSSAEPKEGYPDRSFQEEAMRWCMVLIVPFLLAIAPDALAQYRVDTLVLGDVQSLAMRPEQVLALSALREEFVPAMQRLRSSMEVLRDQLRAPALDRVDARGARMLLKDEYDADLARLLVLRGELIAAVRSLLTPEQRNKLDQIAHQGSSARRLAGPIPQEPRGLTEPHRAVDPSVLLPFEYLL